MIVGTTLTIRNIDETVKEKLRIQAARNGRSMEAETREILAAALRQTEVSELAFRKEESACTSVRGIWKSRLSTDELMALTRGE